MIRALAGRSALVLAFILAILSPALPVFGYIVAALVVVGFITCCSAQKHVWHDGWHAAHEHHRIHHPRRHLNEYQRFLNRTT